jgi:PqqA peptide cyclase
MIIRFPAPARDCRCQAYLLTGDPANPDPVCDLSPHHHLVTEAVDRAERRGQLASEQPLVFRRYRTGEGTREQPK